MSTSSLSVLGNSSNLISANPPGLASPTVCPFITFPAAGGTYYPIVSGSVISVPVLGAVGTISLPPVVSSVGYQFVVVCQGTLANNLTISAPANTLRGFTVQPTAVGAGSTALLHQASGVTGDQGNTTIVISGANSKKGDRISLSCDGVQWIYQAWSNTPSATTVFTYT